MKILYHLKKKRKRMRKRKKKVRNMNNLKKINLLNKKDNLKISKKKKL